MPAAHTDGAAGAQRVEHHAAGRLDGLAHGAAVFAGVRLPARRVAAGGERGVQVGGQDGEAAVYLGNGAAGRQVGVQAPDHQGQQRGPQPAGDEASGEGGGGGQVRQGTVERQDHGEAEQVAELLADLAVDAGEGQRE